MKQWNSLSNYSDIGSLCSSIAKPSDLIDKAVEMEMGTIAITDHDSLAGVIECLNAAKGKPIKPILGCTFSINSNPSEQTKENKDCSQLVILSKSLQGWKSLVKANNLAHSQFYLNPRLALESFDPEGLICIGGTVDSSISRILFTDWRGAFNSRSYDDCKSFIDPDWYKKSARLIHQHIDIFGKENFALGLQSFDKDNWPVVNVICKALRYIGKKEKIRCVGLGETRYLEREDARDLMVVLCKKNKTTIPKVMSAMAAGEIVENGQFFRSMNYSMISPERANELYSEEELENTLMVADMIEKYSLSGPPQLPTFECPDGLGPDEYLRVLAREGWKRKIQGYISKDKINEYAERIKHELKVFQDVQAECNVPELFSKSFLITQDYVNWAVSQGFLVGPGRGSVGGSLLAYLLNITGLDPIRYNLMFERFFNIGRLNKDRVSLPDIDVDFPTDKREVVINYMRDKYGHDKVLQTSTFGRLQGRGCIKEVLRSHSVVGFGEMNRLTDHIPDESKITDDLQEMKDAGKEATIIGWALKNNSKDLKEWCYIAEDGKLEGPLSIFFAQAIRLEGVRVSQGRHASAIGMIADKLDPLIPKSYNKGDKDHMIIGVEHHAMEQFGVLKADMLGTTVLNCIQGISEMLSGD